MARWVIPRYKHKEVVLEHSVTKLCHNDVIDETPLMLSNVTTHPHSMSELLESLFTICKTHMGYRQTDLNHYETISDILMGYGLENVRKRFRLCYPQYRLFLSKTNKQINVQIAKKLHNEIR